MHSNFFILFSLYLLTIAVEGNSQLQISNIESVVQLKNTTTVLAIPAKDSAINQVFTSIFEENWTVNPIKIITYPQYVFHKNSKGFSYFVFGEERLEGTSNSSYVYLELWTWTNTTDWDKKKKTLIARLELYPDPATTQNTSLIYDYNFGTEGHIYNWSPGLFKNYIQYINKSLNNHQEIALLKPYEIQSALQNLKHKTLYIPEYTLQQFSNTQVPKGKIEVTELMKDYPYKFELISNEDLSKKILAAEESFYYLLFVRSNSDKFVSVVDGITGDIIFSRFTPVSYNLNAKDIKKLTKTIE